MLKNGLGITSAGENRGNSRAISLFWPGTLPTMRVEEPSWDGPYFGQFGVLADDGDRVQCHVCGGMYAHLGSHTNHAHGLTADQPASTYDLCL